ncbi:hypothetical protein RR46_01268 [Papilio xuthus]|uniref:Uncharacterized protein n=1 Tax=Papilio xuthus TaxID=66420 RepID=A0A0N0P9M4_PAPXU|nr:hypothetical protein RR46_01268 [Papilio xuthus]
MTGTREGAPSLSHSRSRLSCSSQESARHVPQDAGSAQAERCRTPLASTTIMQYKTPASPPLERRGKNETEIQIYSKKSELHRARGTLTHKMKKITRTPTSTTELKKSEWGTFFFIPS